MKVELPAPGGASSWPEGRGDDPLGIYEAQGTRRLVGVCLSLAGCELPNTLRSLQDLSSPTLRQVRGTGSSEVNRYVYVVINERFFIKFQISNFSKKLEAG